MAFVLHCFSLFALFVVLKFSSSVSLLFSLLHWAPECSFVVYFNTIISSIQKLLTLDGTNPMDSPTSSQKEALKMTTKKLDTAIDQWSTQQEEMKAMLSGEVQGLHHSTGNT